MPLIVPEAFKTLDPNQPSVVFREQPLHYNDVRLIVALPDPETKQLRDTIVANIAMSKVFHDKREDERRWTRYIKGTSIEIPWPKKEEKEYFDQLADTRIMDVEATTYIPTLLRPPFPISVIDELRNKYSVFRTRHDAEFIEKVEAIAANQKAKEEAVIKTPVQLLNKKLREEKKARGKPVLTPEIMEQIGRVMAQNRPELLERVKQPQMDID
jgi:large subunit ribosomal protein L24